MADVTDEDAERSKRFDEEVGSVTRNRGTMAGTSKAGGITARMKLLLALRTER